MIDSADRLSGWKEIAAHLRRSVRSVQRWEHELGLPVLRMRTPHGQMLFASKAALDAWMAGLNELPTDVPDAPHGPLTEDEPNGGAALHSAPDMGVEPSSLPEDSVIDAPALAAATQLPSPEVSAPTQAVRPSAVFRWRWAFAAVVGAALIWIAGTGMASGRRVASVQFIGEALEARAADGRPVWTHQFGRVVSRVNLRRTEHRLSDSSDDVDITANGRAEHLVAVRFASAGKASGESDQLMAFDADGQVKWTATPQALVRCGVTAYEGPWRISDVLVSSAPGPKRVWVSFIHHTWWPSQIIEVAPDGTQTLRYLQAGWVRSMAELHTPSGDYLAAGGVLNERALASVVVFDPTKPLTFAAGDDPKWNCAGGAVSPQQVTLLPRFDITEAQGSPYAMVGLLEPVGDAIRIEINGLALATMQAGGTISDWSFTDMFWKAHDSLSQARSLDHEAAACPEMSTPHEVRTWTPGSGWNSYFILALPK